MTLERAKTAREIGITRGKYELAKKREARARSVRSHGELLSDKALMEIRSPADGTVYFGRCVNGQWGEISTIASKLTPFGTIPPNTVMMTVVDQRPLYVLSNLSEKALSEFKEGLAAVITPTADSDVELAAKVKKLAGIPGASRKFEMHFDLGDDELPEWVVAGMSCSAKVTTYEKDDALQVRKEYVQTDKDNDKIKYVLLQSSEGDEPVRKEVKLGHSKGNYVEILEGLDSGDKIVKKESSKDSSADDEESEEE